MYKRTMIYGLLLCLSAFVTTAQAKTLALVIGIDDYIDKPLDGAVNDAKDIYNALIKYAVDKQEDVIFLDNKKATKQAIQAAWDKMVRDSDYGDTLLVTYAGHGSQVVDNDKDEEDGMDEVFLLSEYREMGANVKEQMISDDEWYRWFNAAKGKDRQVVFVADACHSGTLHRSLNPRAKSRNYQILSNDDIPPPEHVKVKPKPPQDYVTFFAATTENMDSYERQIKGKARGALSYAFAEAVRGAADNGDKVLLKQELESYLHDTITALTEGTNKQVPQFVPEGFKSKPLIALNRLGVKVQPVVKQAFDVVFKQGTVNRSGTKVKIQMTHLPHPYLTLYNLAGDGTVQFLYPLQGDQPHIATDQAFALQLEVDRINGDEQLVAIVSPKQLSKVHKLLQKQHNKQADNTFDTQLSTLLAHENFASKRVLHKVK